MHTLTHALNPNTCHCENNDITNCVICNKELIANRKHTDTCGNRCFTKLISLQNQK